MDLRVPPVPVQDIDGAGAGDVARQLHVKREKARNKDRSILLTKRLRFSQGDQELEGGQAQDDVGDADWRVRYITVAVRKRRICGMPPSRSIQ
jgi:hypothetical protein